MGLVELSDEEHAIHGPRLSRYSRNWAWYLGYHWTHRREHGESQLTFNYVQALADFIADFSFTRGVHFKSAKEYAHIVPALLNRVWEVDNDKPSVLAEMAQQGGVSGDVFVKVAYDPEWNDTAGNWHPGRVRILPLNSSHCFPEWHPHDRGRLIRFKLKYRFFATSLEGTRQVMTYTEIITDDVIEEFVDDQLIDSRPNPLGVIPVVHIPNVFVSGSPWGQSDIESIISLNREYNEKATEVSDIIGYHAAPITVVTGAKVSNLQRGAKNVWGGLPPDANVYNLENGVDLAGPLAYLELLKRSMHEMTGVPETALGQMQPISNTSGVALAIQYQPAMQKYARKKRTYTTGLVRINELVLRTLFLFEPETLTYDPTMDGIIQDGQPTRVDPRDPLLYQTECSWPPPLPVDALIKLNEVQMMLMLGLESKRGALHSMGEEFPDEKMAEIFDELKQDAIEKGALDMLNAQIASAIVSVTGVLPQGDGPPEPLTATTSESAGSGPAMPPLPKQPDVLAGLEEKLTNQIVTTAYGSKIPQRRNPDNDNA
ncbi:phage portal protein [Streptosporangium sp. NPDC023825]|uniref:phage portal protein n=1 Tax=Streptosporangium sp. NPDC023825 TaxID=3154909 RepID=UPI0034483146